MVDFKIITIENDESFVTIDTLVKFSGNAEDSVRQLIRKNKEDLVEFGLAYRAEFSKTDILKESELTYSELRFSEDAASYLLTLMANSPEVKLFKKNLIKEFRRLKNQGEVVLTPMQHMELANKMLLEQAENDKKELEFKAKLLKGNETLIQNIADDVDDSEIDMEEYCQLLSSRATDTYLGRTKVYELLRLMRLVKVGKTTPTQYATEAGLLKRRHHENGVSTKVVRERMSLLTAKVIKYLLNNPDVNESLGFPFHPELRD